MKFSIITATWNRSRTLQQAIESLAAQTFQDYEHIVQDGGSDDGTMELLERYGDPRRKVVSARDDGIYDALNKALERCSGDVIGLLHSDDFYADNLVLDRVAAAFLGTKADSVHGDLDYVSAQDTGKIIRHWKSGDYRPERLRRGWMPPHPALFLKREVIEQFGGYDTSFRISADYDSILRYFVKGRMTSAYVPEVLVKMRVGGESNRSLERIIRKSTEDLRAIRKNNVGGLSVLACKNIRKIPQFVSR